MVYTSLVVLYRQAPLHVESLMMTIKRLLALIVSLCIFLLIKRYRHFHLIGWVSCHHLLCESHKRPTLIRHNIPNLECHQSETISLEPLGRVLCIRSFVRINFEYPVTTTAMNSLTLNFSGTELLLLKSQIDHSIARLILS